MSDKPPLPSRDELKLFIDSLTPPIEEMDEVSATVVLERAGVDVHAFPVDLMTRLDREIEELRTRGEEIPGPLTELAEVLHHQSQAAEEEELLDPETHIPRLLAGEVQSGSTTSRVASFRELRGDLLTEEDIQTLQDLYEELKARRSS